MGLANISFSASKYFKFNLEGLYSKSNFQEYDHEYRLNPDGNVNKFSNSYTSTFTMTHTFSSSSFYTIKGSYFFRDFNEYLYENPLDKRYVHPDSLNSILYAFKDGGTNLHRFFRETNTFLGKLDYTSQVHENHLLKFGFEGRMDKLEFDDYNLEPKTINNVPVVPFESSIPDINSFNIR